MMKNSSTHTQKILLWLIFGVLSILYIFPFIHLSSPHIDFLNGDDYSFHFNRIFGIIEDLKTSLLPQYVNSQSVKKVMYGVNFFYPFLTTAYPIALLYLLIHSVIKSFYIYVILLTFITFFISYYSFHSVWLTIFIDEKFKTLHYPSLLFSILYTFSSYRLACTFVRFSLGETVALTLLPLIFSGFYNIMFGNGKQYYYLVLGLSALAYTHFLSIFVTTFLLFIFFLVYIRHLDKKKFLLFFKSGLWTIALSIWGIVPMLQQMQYFPINGVHPYQLNEETTNLFHLISDGLKNESNTYSIGPIAIITLFIGIYYLFFVQSKNKFFTHCYFWGAGLFIFSSKLFPWSILQHTPLSAIQFPWRLFAYTTLFLSIFLVFILVKLTSYHFAISSYILISVIFICTFLNFSSINQVKNIRNAEGMHKGEYVLHSDEEATQTTIYKTYTNLDYLPKSPLMGEIVEKIGHVGSIPIKVDYTYQNHAFETIIIVEEKRAVVDLPFIAYKGLEIKDKEHLIPFTISKRGTTQIELSKGTYNLVVTYHPTLIIKLSFWISLISLFIFLFFILFKPKEKYLYDTY